MLDVVRRTLDAPIVETGVPLAALRPHETVRVT